MGRRSRPKQGASDFASGQAGCRPSRVPATSRAASGCPASRERLPKQGASDFASQAGCQRLRDRRLRERRLRERPSRVQQGASDFASGYARTERLAGALEGDDLLSRVADAHAIGIRSRTQLTEGVLDAARRLFCVGCFQKGANDLTQAASKKVPTTSPRSKTLRFQRRRVGDIPVSTGIDTQNDIRRSPPKKVPTTSQEEDDSRNRRRRIARSRGPAREPVRRFGAEWGGFAGRGGGGVVRSVRRGRGLVHEAVGRSGVEGSSPGGRPRR